MNFFSRLIARCQGRSPEWPAARAAHLKRQPECAVCGKPAKVVHHVVPFHVEPEKELDADNLVSFCGDRCHLAFGHLFCWSSWNPQVIADCAWWRTKISERPCDMLQNKSMRCSRLFRWNCLALALVLGLCGCAGPNPTQTRISLLTIESKTVVINGWGQTNAVRSVFSRDQDSQTIQPSQRGVCLFFDNQIAFPNGSGTASSNSVFSGIEIPLVK